MPNAYVERNFRSRPWRRGIPAWWERGAHGGFEQARPSSNFISDLHNRLQGRKVANRCDLSASSPRARHSHAPVIHCLFVSLTMPLKIEIVDRTRSYRVYIRESATVNICLVCYSFRNYISFVKSDGNWCAVYDMIRPTSGIRYARWVTGERNVSSASRGFEGAGKMLETIRTAGRRERRECYFRLPRKQQAPNKRCPFGFTG